MAYLPPLSVDKLILYQLTGWNFQSPGLLHCKILPTSRMISMSLKRRELFTQQKREIFLYPHGETAPSGPGPPHFRGSKITLRHTTFGKAPLNGWSARITECTWQHPLLSRERHACPWRDSNRKIQQANGFRPRGHWDQQRIIVIFIYLFYLQLGWHPVAVVQHTFTHKQHTEYWKRNIYNNPE
jgi:hypothetical protein